MVRRPCCRFQVHCCHQIRAERLASERVNNYTTRVPPIARHKPNSSLTAVDVQQQFTAYRLACPSFRERLRRQSELEVVYVWSRRCPAFRTPEGQSLRAGATLLIRLSRAIPCQGQHALQMGRLPLPRPHLPINRCRVSNPSYQTQGSAPFQPETA